MPGVASAAYVYSPSHYPGTTETLVEGHTVFALLQSHLCIHHPSDPPNATYVRDSDCRGNAQRKRGSVSYTSYNVSVQRLGTAVAVLVRDRAKPFYPSPAPPGDCLANRDVVATVLYENPGVLWFNDRFLVGDDLDVVETRVDANVDVCRKHVDVVFDRDELEWRYPCGGWVLATQADNPDPRGMAWEYTESYRIVDPNDYVWVVDRFQTRAAVVGVDVPGPFTRTFGDYTVSAIVGRDNASLDAFYGSPLVMWSVPVLGNDEEDPGPTSGWSCEPYDDDAPHRGAPNPTYDDGDPTDYTARRYNAVLFFFFEDLVASSRLPKVHGNGGPDDGDVTGCEVDTEWGCPAAGDDVEGNSHPYNPVETGSGPRHVHPTAAVDLYYSNVRPPSPNETDRDYAIFDTVGSGAPHHTHTSTEPVDDRFTFSRCSDRDRDKWTYTYTYDEPSDTMTLSNSTYSHSETSRSGDGENPTDGQDTSDCNSWD